MKKITILLVIVSPNVYGQTKNWKVYTHENYSIRYPDNWELEENQIGSKFVLISPVDTANPSFNENINLIIQDLKGPDMNLDKYNEISVSQIKKYLPDDSILSDKREKDRTGEYQHIQYYGDENNNHLQFEQYYRIINGKAYILTLTTLKKQWEKAHQVGEQILNSFLVKK